MLDKCNLKSNLQPFTALIGLKREVKYTIMHTLVVFT